MNLNYFGSQLKQTPNNLDIYSDKKMRERFEKI